MSVTFCGHGNIFYDEHTKNLLYNELEKLIISSENRFYLGGYGNFDALAAKTLKKLKEPYPFIESILIIPYLDKKYTADLYDYTLYPPIETFPKKLAILKRNEWMVENCDVVVAYVRRCSGGSAKTLSFAMKKRKKIVHL